MEGVGPGHDLPYLYKERCGKTLTGWLFYFFPRCLCALRPPLLPPLKYVVGIDIAKAPCVACFGRIDPGQALSFGKETTCASTATGFAALLAWTAKQQVAAAAQWFVLEATGVHHEELAYFLADNAQTLRVLLPNKVKHFAPRTEQKRKTDQLDARRRYRMGLERACRLGNHRRLPCVSCAPFPANGRA